MRYPVLKNMACAAVSLTAVLTSITIVVNSYLQNDVNSSINTISTLTGGNLDLWGLYPGYNDLKLEKQIQFLSLDVEQTDPSDLPAWFDCQSNINLKQGQAYSYERLMAFKNVTQMTGSGGYVTYYKNESLVDDNLAQIETSQQDIMMMFNEGILQGYYEEVYSPMARKMPLYLYNLKQQMMDSLATYFARMMQVFNLGDQTYTQKVVFDPLEISADTQQKLWDDEYYGWKDEVTLGKWVKIVLSTEYANYQDFGTIQAYFGLSTTEMTGLAGKSSMLNKLSWLINGTLADAVIQYGSSACEDLGLFCSNSELVSSQWAQGILTASDIFLYNKNMVPFSFHDLNMSIPLNAELGLYAPSNINANDGMNLLSVNTTSEDMWSPLDTTKTITLISYYNMANLYNNKDNAGIINFNLKLYDVTKVPPLISYLDNMETNLILKNDTYPGLGTQSTVTSAWFMFRGFNTVFNTISDLTISNLYARAAFNLLTSEKIECATLFADETLASMLPICTKKGYKAWNPVNSYTSNIPFAFAFLGNTGCDDYQNILNQLQITSTQLSYFLYNTDNSPYAKLLAQIQDELKTFYGCLTYCTSRELGTKQWFSAGITTNLPPSPYFIESDTVPSISDWDTENTLPSKLLPEIQLYVSTNGGDKIDFSVYAQDYLLDTNIGSILTWSSLHEFILQTTSSNTTALTATFGLDLTSATWVLNYLKHVVIEQIFGGVYIQVQASDMLWGYEDQFLLQKAGWKQVDGGQGWIKPQRSVLKRNNFQEAANLLSNQVYWINTGLQDIDNVNNILKIFGSTTVSINYYVWSANSTYANSISSQIYPYLQSQTVSGSTGFGFSTKLDSNQQLTWIDEKYSRITPLTQVGETTFESQKVYKYSFIPNSQTSETFADNLSGTLNMTSSAFNSLYISDLYFNGASGLSTLTSMLYLNGTQFSQVPQSEGISTDATSSYFYVEPLTGKTVQIAQNEQHNLLLEQGLIFDPYHLKGSCLLPTYFDLYGMKYSSSLISSQFSTLNSNSSTQKTTLIVFIVLTSVFFAISVALSILAIRARKQHKQRVNIETLNEPLRQGGTRNQISENTYDSSVQRTFNTQNQGIQQ